MYPSLRIYAYYHGTTVCSAFVEAWTWKHGYAPEDKEMDDIIHDYVGWEDWGKAIPAYVEEFLQYKNGRDR